MEDEAKDGYGPEEAAEAFLVPRFEASLLMELHISLPAFSFSFEVYTLLGLVWTYICLVSAPNRLIFLKSDKVIEEAFLCRGAQPGGVLYALCDWYYWAVGLVF